MPDTGAAAAWLGKPKAAKVRVSELDSSTWVGKDEARRLLKVSDRQVERLARDGRIQKQYLPRAPSEKAARVVYSRADIDAVLAGGTSSRYETPTAEDLGIDKAEMRDALAGIEDMSRDEVCIYLDRSPHAVQYLVATGRLHPRYEETERGRAGVFSGAEVEALRKHLAPPVATTGATTPDALTQLSQALASSKPPAQQKPWLTLDEASSFSGLPKAFLLNQARAGTWPGALDVGKARGGRWRFRRESL